MNWPRQIHTQYWSLKTSKRLLISLLGGLTLCGREKISQYQIFSLGVLQQIVGRLFQELKDLEAPGVACDRAILGACRGAS